MEVVWLCIVLLVFGVFFGTSCWALLEETPAESFGVSATNKLCDWEQLSRSVQKEAWASAKFRGCWGHLGSVFAGARRLWAKGQKVGFGQLRCS